MEISLPSGCSSGYFQVNCSRTRQTTAVPRGWVSPLANRPRGVRYYMQGSREREVEAERGAHDCGDYHAHAEGACWGKVVMVVTLIGEIIQEVVVGLGVGLLRKPLNTSVRWLGHHLEDGAAGAWRRVSAVIAAHIPHALPSRALATLPAAVGVMPDMTGWSVRTQTTGMLPMQRFERDARALGLLAASGRPPLPTRYKSSHKALTKQDEEGATALSLSRLVSSRLLSSPLPSSPLVSSPPPRTPASVVR